jgi:hypothetical protein
LVAKPALTTHRTRGTLFQLESRPRNATASTHHRRDEQSNADGNLTGFLLPVVLHMGRRKSDVSLVKPGLPAGFRLRFAMAVGACAEKLLTTEFLA